MIKSQISSWMIVKDLEKAKKIYVDILGMKLLGTPSNSFFEVQFEDGKSFSVFSIETILETIHESNKHYKSLIKEGMNSVVVFEVDNIEQMIEKGLEIIGNIMHISNGSKIALIKDQDGNLIQLFQKKI